MRALIALDGNALLPGGEQAPARALAALAAEHEVVLAHFFDARLGAEFGLALRNALPDRELATMIVDVVVGAGGPAFVPTHSVLEPQAIVELRCLRTLVDAGALAICALGGGIPVALEDDGTMRGVEAAVDEGLTASLLARRLDADLLVLLSADGAAGPGRGPEAAPAPGRVTPAELRRHGLAAGSIAPKVDAACRFVEATGRRAAIGELSQAVEVVRGLSGTQVSAPST